MGARTCFGVVGTTNFKFTHGLVEAGVKYVAARHECNAVAMGDAYAKATGELTLVRCGDAKLHRFFEIDAASSGARPGRER